MKNFSPIKSRIRQFIDFQGIDIAAVYQKSGISDGTLSNESGLKESNLLKFFSSFPEISAEWLLTGEGEMFRNQPMSVARLAGPDEVGIPLLAVTAMAGDARGEFQVGDHDGERFVVPTFRGADYLIPVRGSSMYPKYNSGDIVACKRLPLKDIFFQWNKVYVLDTDQGALIKRILQGRDEEYIQLVSENKDYPPFELHRERLNAVALVIGVIRLE